MGRQVDPVTMSEDGGQAAGGQVVIVCEDKATSTDDELLGSPSADDVFGPDNCFRYMAHTAQLWGADLVGLERPHSARGGRYLRHQESLSSNSDVSRPHRQVKLRRQRASESGDADKRPKTRELRRQWTTDSSDSGYSKRYSRELRRQDTEESADSTRRLIRDLQRQPTTESSSSLRLTRQSSIRSASDNQSLCLLRQSTVETYDDISTTDFSRPQSCNSSRNPSAAGAITDYPAHTPTDAAHHHPQAAAAACGHTVLTEYAAPGHTLTYDPQDLRDLVNGYDYTVGAIPARARAPLLSTASCSLINLSAVDLEAAEITELHKSLRALGPAAQTKTRRKRSRRGSETEALKQAKERVRRRKEDEEMPRKVRWSIMATGLILLLMSVILVGATLKMAPLIDEMVRKENLEILRELQAASSGGNTSITTVSPTSTSPGHTSTSPEHTSTSTGHTTTT
ncbi:uncharacterized protein [Procambarus clarkii]|uniref:uncharacterized protein n=1 Tax=Procambarus clarkii TaxID=6728 RepID=UPI003744AD8D